MDEFDCNEVFRELNISSFNLITINVEVLPLLRIGAFKDLLSKL